MSFFERLKSMFTASDLDRRSYWVHVQCDRCGEVISSRVDLFNDLSQDFETKQFVSHKTLVGSGKYHCFQRIDITLTFDKNKRLIDRSIRGGTFLHPNEVEAAQAAYEQRMREAEAARQARLAELAARAQQASSETSPDTHDSPS